MTEKTLKPGWKMVKFGDVVRLNTDRIADPLAAGIERYVGLEHITPEDLHIHSWGLVAEGTTFTNYFKPGQVLFGKRRAYQRKVAVAEFEGVCSGDIYVFESKDPEVLLPELLPFICQTEGFYNYALETSAGSLSPRTNWSHLADFEFSLPPLNDQIRISTLINEANRTLELWRQALNSLEVLKESLSEEIFAQSDVTNNVVCEKLCREITVGIVVKPANYYVSKGIPALRSLNVFSDRFVLDDLVYISEEANDLLSKSRLTVGDVVIVRSGRPGDAAVIGPDLDGCNCIDLIIARPGDSILPRYLSRYINSIAGQKSISKGTAGTAQLHFNVTQMKRMLIPLVTLEKQNEIVNQLDYLDKEIQEVNKRIDRSSELTKALISTLLSC